MNIAQQVFRIDIMVAVIEIAICFQRKRMTAGFCMHAQHRRLPHPGGQREIKHLDIDTIYVTTNPDIKNLIKELAVLRAGTVRGASVAALSPASPVSTGWTR